MGVKFPRASRAVAVVAAAVTISAPLLIMSGEAAAAGPSPTALVPVTGGAQVQAVNGAKPLGPATPYTSLALSFILKPQHAQQLYASAGRDLRDSFVTEKQFAAEYGARPTYVAQLEQYLSKFGISDFTLYANGLDLKAVGTTTEVDRAFGVNEQIYQVPAVPAAHGMQGIPAQRVYAPQNNATVPEKLAKTIVAILGLTNYAPWVTQTARTTATPNSSSSTTCVKLSGLPSACNTPKNFASDYDLTNLYKRGDRGQGQTIGIVTLAALDKTAPAYFWANVMHLAPSGRTVKVVTVDGGPGAPSTAAGTGETDLDTEQSGGLAPDANVRVYQAPNTTAGFVDGFMTAASENVAGTVSSSWGESEAVLDAFGAGGFLSPGYVQSFDEAFAEMAVQGQSLFIASGDSAAYADNRTTGGEWTTLGVGSPASSPYVTAAGGTTLPWFGTATFTFGAGGGTDLVSAHVEVGAQRAWGWDYLVRALSKTNHIPFADLARSFIIGSTGGYSHMEAMPSYQKVVPGITNSTDLQFFTPTKEVTAGTTPFGAHYGLKGYNVVTTVSVTAKPGVSYSSGSGRAVPDVSADADPFTGYLLYNPSASTGKPLQGGWGGTSFVAPQLNGSNAVMESAVGHRIGLWNPSIYSFAVGPNSPFKPLDQTGTTNDNWYYTGTAGSVYNPATGLGIPDLTNLAIDFALNARG
jgi:kumamolisin